MTRIVLIVACLLAAGRPALAQDIRVMTSGTFTAPYLALVPELERLVNGRMVTVTTTMGTGEVSIPSRLARGEAADVVIVADEALRQLIDDGLVLGDSRVPLVRSSIAMAVRAGAPKPDISTVDAFTRTLLEAGSIAYSASVSGSYLSTELFERLGVAERVLPKSRRIEGERVGAVVARGEAEVGFQQMSELLPEPGIDIVGPLPEEIQLVSVFSAGVAAHSQHPDAARAVIAFLASPAAADAIRKAGLEPLPPASSGLDLGRGLDLYSSLGWLRGAREGRRSSKKGTCHARLHVVRHRIARGRWPPHRRGPEPQPGTRRHEPCGDGRAEPG